MSAILDMVRAVLAGDPSMLLPACRAEAFGAEAFGADAVAGMFARHTAPLSDTPHVIETETGLALFDTDAQAHDQAIVADLYDGRVGRLWRVGPGTTDDTAEPGIAVAADAFMTQVRAPWAFAASDHPALDAAAIPALQSIGQDIAAAGDGARRCFVVRAFSSGDTGAALFAVYADRGAMLRTHATTYAAAAFRFNNGTIVHRRVVTDGVEKPARMPAF